MRPTDIEWCDYSANPIKLRLHESGKLVNVCVKCSPGCGNCYAESIIRHWWRKDWGKFPGYSAAILKLGQIVVQEDELRAMLSFRPKGPLDSTGPLGTGRFKHGAKRPSVFVEDMGDLFGPWVPFELIDRCFATFALRPDVDWLILTKRIERAAEYLNDPTATWDFFQDRLGPHMNELQGIRWDNPRLAFKWPLPNVWLGTSVEDQKRADERIPMLLKCPATKRFLSCEPLLGALDLWKHFMGFVDAPCIDWVIAGGESGPGARPMHPDWARGIRDQCVEAGVPFFFKQWGTWKPISEMPEAEHSALYKSNRIAKEHESQDNIDEAYGRRCTVETTSVMYNGRTGPGFHSIDGHIAFQTFRLGKERAGRLLDGREWNQKPFDGAQDRPGVEEREAASGGPFDSRCSLRAGGDRMRDYHRYTVGFFSIDPPGDALAAVAIELTEDHVRDPVFLRHVLEGQLRHRGPARAMAALFAGQRTKEQLGHVALAIYPQAEAGPAQ